MQLVKQQGDNKAIMRRSRGAVKKWRTFRMLTVANRRFSRLAREN